MKNNKILLFLAINSALLINGCKQTEKPKDSFSLTQWNIYLGNGDGNSIKNSLASLSSDIVFLEECSNDAYSKCINEYVKENEKYILPEKVLNTGETNYVPILFDHTKFNYVDSFAKKFNDGSSVNYSKAYMYLILERNDNYYCFINMHGSVCRNKYSGYESYTQEEIDEIANQWRISNTNEVIAKANDLKETFGNDLKIIIGGDCNFNSESTPYKILKNNSYNDSELVAEFKETNFYKTSRTWGNEFYSNGLSIDHVFGNENVEFKSQKYIRDDNVNKGSDHALNSLEIYY